MNNIELDEARELWLSEQNYYEEYGNDLVKEIEAAFKSASIQATFSYRIKENESLLKKMLRKNISYSALTDKVGARAIVHFLSDLSQSDELIQRTFGERIIKRQNKVEIADNDTFGYLSIHYDIVNNVSSENIMICEFQLRTVCQNAWSELSHILSYKPDIELPHNIKREVNALSALMEIADNQFQRILDMINILPTSNPTRILRLLGDFFYSRIAAWYDSELSQYFLNDVAILYEPNDDIISILQTFIDDNGDDIASIATERKDVLFFSQPEIVVILERLEKKPLILEDYWTTKFPKDQLEAVANAWGMST
ncbi:MAG: GTP pyrophosphokinase [Deltaproteobacteria bacterium]